MIRFSCEVPRKIDVLLSFALLWCCEIIGLGTGKSKRIKWLMNNLELKWFTPDRFRACLTNLTRSHISMDLYDLKEHQWLMLDRILQFCLAEQGQLIIQDYFWDVDYDTPAAVYAKLSEPAKRIANFSDTAEAAIKRRMPTLEQVTATKFVAE